MSRWRCVGFELEGLITLKDSWERRRLLEPNCCFISTCCGLVEGRLIDAMLVGLRRDPLPPGPPIMAAHTHYLFHIFEMMIIMSCRIHAPHEIPVETTPKADPFRVWHARYHPCRVSPTKKWTDFLTVICSIMLILES